MVPQFLLDLVGAVLNLKPSAAQKHSDRYAQVALLVVGIFVETLFWAFADADWRVKAAVLFVSLILLSAVIWTCPDQRLLRFRRQAAIIAFVLLALALIIPLNREKNREEILAAVQFQCPSVDNISPTWKPTNKNHFDVAPLFESLYDSKYSSELGAPLEAAYIPSGFVRESFYDNARTIWMFGEPGFLILYTCSGQWQSHKDAFNAMDLSSVNAELSQRGFFPPPREHFPTGGMALLVRQDPKTWLSRLGWEAYDDCVFPKAQFQEFQGGYMIGEIAPAGVTKLRYIAVLLKRDSLFYLEASPKIARGPCSNG